ncbi:hypothetical protein SKAU_G00140950 [Synaphobranchus kaupii]|uniref:Uncharacterized protein n=1 Tax=Synaphobranchus kaupii TaxID=118154 RepID=A0A9Q1FSP1_SYNKA|nr:hypothetical protein SKAU_G00140950 [Synaphobranchus kaupii]
MFMDLHLLRGQYLLRLQHWCLLLLWYPYLFQHQHLLLNLLLVFQGLLLRLASPLGQEQKGLKCSLLCAWMSDHDVGFVDFYPTVRALLPFYPSVVEWWEAAKASGAGWWGAAGVPTLALLYVLFMEPLAELVRLDPGIDGVLIPGAAVPRVEALSPAYRAVVQLLRKCPLLVERDVLLDDKAWYGALASKLVVSRTAIPLGVDWSRVSGGRAPGVVRDLH